MIDPLDDQLSANQLVPLLRGLDGEQLQALLLSLGRDGVEPMRSKARALVAQFFARSDPRAVIELAGELTGARSRSIRRGAK